MPSPSILSGKGTLMADEHLKHLALGKPEGEPADSDMLGACVSLARMKGLFGIGFKRPGMPDKIVEYLDVEGEGDNAAISFVMGARRVWRVDIAGLRLLRLLYHIKEHRVDWIRAADRDFDPDDGHPFISSIKLTDVTPGK